MSDDFAGLPEHHQPSNFSRHATNAEVRESATRMLEKHRPSLEKLAGQPPSSPCGGLDDHARGGTKGSSPSSSASTLAARLVEPPRDKEIHEEDHPRVDSICTTRTREFECFFNFIGWHQWSLGIHIDAWHPHVDIHVPGGFLRVGWMSHRVIEQRATRRPKAFYVYNPNPDMTEF